MGKVGLTQAVAETDGHLLLITVFKQSWAAISDTINSYLCRKHGIEAFSPKEFFFFLSMIVIVYTAMKTSGCKQIFQSIIHMTGTHSTKKSNVRKTKCN